jgi:hypothetical protein
MRNGVYRVWYKGSGIEGTTATLLVNGEFIASDRTHSYLGSYTEVGEHFSADVKVSRHTLLTPSPEIPDLDEFHLHIEGGSTEEIIDGHCTVPEKPDFKLAVQYIWVSEI